MFDDFIYRYRFIIGGILIFVILSGSGLIIWNRYKRSEKSKVNQEAAELRAQNDLLRQQLANQSSKSVAGTETSEKQSDKINLNTADVTELDKLPGIGPAKAADIISYREEHNGFQSIEEINNVKGIGDKTFENLKDLITVGE